MEYEQRGHDYPIGYVRWTEQRNMQAILDLMLRGTLDVKPLITHRIAVEHASTAYEIVKTGSQPYLGIVLNYPTSNTPPARRLELKSAPVADGKMVIGCIGSGGFARGVLLPAIRKLKHASLHTLCSAGGLSASVGAANLGFAHAASDDEEIFKDLAINTTFIVTRHHQHASQVIKSLRVENTRLSKNHWHSVWTNWPRSKKRSPI